MRRFFPILVVVLATALGCTQTRWSMFKRTPKKTEPAGVPTVAQLVDYLNDNAGRVKTLRTNELRLSAKHGLKPAIGLRGNMIARMPRDFRMSAGLKLLEKTEVDIGSNDKEFWYQINKADPPYQYYCSYADLEAGRVKHLPFPFKPDWIMEAMGLGPYGPASRYTMESDENEFRLIEKTVSPQGTPTRKVIVFNRKATTVPNPQVLAFLLIDEKSNKEICSARITKTQLDRATNAILPYTMKLYWPANRFTLTISFDSLEVNSKRAPSEIAFVRPKLENMSFNLALMRPDAGVQQVEGTLR